MPCAAWVSTSSYYNKDSDGEIDESSTENAWVFPDGLELGRQVQYFRKEHSASGYPRYAALNSDDSQTFAVGEVASIDKNVVNFTWAGAAHQKNSEAWSKAPQPMAALQMEPSSDQHCHQGHGRAREERSNNARRCDEHRIHAPTEAWALVPHQTFVVTLASLDAIADGRIRLQLITMGGDKFDVQLPKDSATTALMQSIAEQRRLGPCAHVSIVNVNGELLQPLSVLRC